MSLDVYLTTEETNLKKVGSGIFIRENGETKEITIEEWYEKHPGVTPLSINPTTEETIEETNEVYSANITHNLNTMAEKAGIYLHLWRPDEINITKAKELIEPLRQGLHQLKLEPDVYKELNPDNGWGTYEQLVRFVENYLNACYQYPDANVNVSR